MAKRSNKPNKQQLEKITRAQHRNNYLKSVQKICYSIAGNDVFKLFPTDQLDLLYNARMQAFKVVAGKGENISEDIIKDAVSLVSPVTKRINTPITRSGVTISIHDYFTVALSFLVYLTNLKETDFSKASEIRKYLSDFYTYDESINKANEQMRHIIQTFGNMNSDLGKQLFWLNHSANTTIDRKYVVRNLIEIHVVIPEQIQVTIDGNTRPAIRAGWCFANFGIEYNVLKPSELGVVSPFAAIPIDVYIQNHALLRLRERLDNVMIGFVYFSLFMSLKFPKAIQDKNGNILIEYRFMDIKAGYLRADLINGIVLIRTFLFLTNNGTPEGEKLEEVCGLEKLDKKYLAIDKVSAFMSSGIGSNEELNKIFKRSGCESLLELYRKFQPMITKETGQSTTDLLVKFLGLGSNTVLVSKK